jgi:flagellar motor switch protein FliN/FliY
MSSTDLRTIMKLEVPIVVVLGQRGVKIQEILNWIPGTIIEFGTEAEEDLEVRINNKPVGTGTAVKVGENFGVQIRYIGDPKERIAAMGPDDEGASPQINDNSDLNDEDAEAMAAALLDEQG